MPHAVPLGDSIFDTAAYVGGGPDVVAHLRWMLRPEWLATLVAVDDRIVRVAASRGLPVIEPRLVCTQPGDYANPIEPSVGRGEKIAAAIVHSLVERRPDARRAEIFGEAALPPAPKHGG